MRNQSLTRRYARALLELGVEKQSVEAFGEQIGALAEVISGSADLSRILYGAMFAAASRKAILESLCKKAGAAKEVRAFLLLLVDKDRLRFLPEVVGQYALLSDEKAGRVRARVVSAAPLDKGVKDKIGERLGKYLRRKVECSFDVEPAVLGGIRAEIGSIVLDGTAREQLDRLTQQLQRG